MRLTCATRTFSRTRRCWTRSTSDVLPNRRGAEITTSWPLRASASSSAISASRSVNASSRASAPKRNGFAGGGAIERPGPHYTEPRYADKRRAGGPMSSGEPRGRIGMKTTHTLNTPEADIVYDVRGPLPTADGRPPLLMIGQPMDAGGFAALASHFPDRTVVTYDPRGLGRSTRKDGRVDNDPSVQAGDVHAVIEALGV